MPRKTKDQKEIENKEGQKKLSVEKENKKNSTPKKVSSKLNSKSDTKKDVKKVTTSKAEKKTSSKSKAKSTTKKVASTKATKRTATKKISKTTKKAVEKKSTSSASARKNKKVEIVEYYDLPYRYNQTIVKILAQTPNNLFIYWDISDSDRQSFERQYGENFFENTRPVLIVHNNTLNYSFEIEINDFANSWYLHVADSKCDYKIELGRRPIFKTQQLYKDYIYVAISNQIEAPNDRVLFDKNQKMVYFRNVKTGKLTGKSVNSISFIRNMEKIYNIYDLYKAIYPNENIEEFLDLSNPSSGNPSSNSLFSKFK